MNTFARRFGITLFISTCLIGSFVWFAKPPQELFIPILVWGVGVLLGVVISRGLGTSCIVNSGVGGAAGVSLFLFYMVPIPPPSNLIFPLLLMIAIGTVSGSVFGTVARWCREGIAIKSPELVTQTPAPTSVRCRWYQFTLQKLLLMFVLTCAVFGSIGLRSIHIRQQSVAMNELRSVGGGFGFRGNWVTHCHLTDPRIRNDHLDELQAFPHLEYLSLEQSKVTDAGMKRLETLYNLAGLRLKGTAITDLSIDSIGRLQNLREVNLENTNVTKNGIEKLRKQLPDCKIAY
jgi:hypothetical protein